MYVRSWGTASGTGKRVSIRLEKPLLRADCLRCKTEKLSEEIALRPIKFRCSSARLPLGHRFDC